MKNIATCVFDLSKILKTQLSFYNSFQYGCYFTQQLMHLQQKQKINIKNIIGLMIYARILLFVLRKWVPTFLFANLTITNEYLSK